MSDQKNIFLGPVRDLLTIIRDEKIGRNVGTYDILQCNYLVLHTISNIK